MAAVFRVNDCMRVVAEVNWSRPDFDDPERDAW
jgi:hypothetical protein